MSRNIIVNRHSLAYPLVVLPRQEAHKAEDVPVPGFPEISLSWDGFFLPHFHLMGINSNIIGSNIWEDLTRYHEEIHSGLSNSFLALLKKYLIQGFIVRALAILREEQVREKLEIPFNVMHSRNDELTNPINELQGLWVEIIRMNAEMAPIEEIFAIWHSLSHMTSEGKISKSQAKSLLSQYKEIYRKNMPEFPLLMDMFKPLAEKVEFNVIACLILFSLSTLSARLTFFDLLNYTSFALKQTPSLANWPSENLVPFFAEFISYCDKDNSRYKSIAASVVEILREKQEISYKLSRGSEFLSKYVLTTPSGKYWKTEYYDEGLGFTFIAKERNDEDELMLICLFFESIRQQITTGIGLQCPFWNAEINECCLEHRSDLELVWKNTTHNPSWQCWERKGCLRT